MTPWYAWNFIRLQRSDATLRCCVWFEWNWTTSAAPVLRSFTIHFFLWWNPVLQFFRQHHRWLRTPRRLKHWRYLGFERWLFHLALKELVFFWQCSELVEGEVCVWKHWPGQPDLAGPVSADPLVSGFPPVFTWNLLFSGHAQDDTGARGIPTRPADREACRARSLDSLRVLSLCNIPPPSKTTDRLTFWFPPAACSARCGCRRRSTTGSGWNVETSESVGEKWRMQRFTSEAGETQTAKVTLNSRWRTLHVDILSLTTGM